MEGTVGSRWPPPAPQRASTASPLALHRTAHTEPPPAGVRSNVCLANQTAAAGRATPRWHGRQRRCRRACAAHLVGADHVDRSQRLDGGLRGSAGLSAVGALQCQQGLGLGQAQAGVVWGASSSLRELCDTNSCCSHIQPRHAAAAGGVTQVCLGAAGDGRPTSCLMMAWLRAMTVTPMASTTVTWVRDWARAGRVAGQRRAHGAGSGVGATGLEAELDTDERTHPPTKTPPTPHTHTQAAVPQPPTMAGRPSGMTATAMDTALSKAPFQSSLARNLASRNAATMI